MDEDITKHPGLILAEEIKARGLTFTQVSKMTGATYTNLTDLCHAYFRLGPLMALRLQQGLGGRTAVEWLELQARFDHAKSLNKLAKLRQAQITGEPIEPSV